MAIGKLNSLFFKELKRMPGKQIVIKQYKDKTVIRTYTYSSMLKKTCQTQK
jgi:hypothetical protein